MKPTRLTAVLKSLLSQRWPAFVWGPPGIGKSSIIRAVAGEAKLPVVDLRAALLDPTDLRGIPAIVDGMAHWCPPSFMPKPTDKPGVLFLDEINAAPPMVQASLYQLVLDRRIGEYELPDGWWIVAAGNRASDRAVTFRLSSALANRFIHLDLEPDASDWREWATERRLSPLVTAFIGLRPTLLASTPSTAPAYPTPRSWEMLSDVLAQFESPEKCVDLIPGIVGEGAAIEFTNYAKRTISEAELLKIVANPSTEPIPLELDRLFVLTSWLAFHCKDETVYEAAATLVNRLPPEFGVVLLRDTLKARPSFISHPGYRTFVSNHADLIRR